MINKKKLLRMKKADLVQEVVRLKDENESLWMMIEEIKASDMKNYKPQFQAMVNRKLRELQLMARKAIKVIPMGKGKS